VPLLDAGDIVIDGGNSYYRDDIRRGGELRSSRSHPLDRGYCLMIGGEADSFEHSGPIFFALGVAAATRTPGRKADVGNAEDGFLHCGPFGTGHVVKMATTASNTA